MWKRRFNQVLVAGLCFGCLARPAALLADTHLRTPSSADVVLRSEGLWVKTVDAAGQPMAQRQITIHRSGQVVAQGLTDASGRFLARGLPAGAYQATTAGSQRLLRAWTHQAAPPAAENELVLWDEPSVVRGQSGQRNVIATPLILGGIVAAVIAISLGLDGDDDDAS